MHGHLHSQWAEAICELRGNNEYNDENPTNKKNYKIKKLITKPIASERALILILYHLRKLETSNIYIGKRKRFSAP